MLVPDGVHVAVDRVAGGYLVNVDLDAKVYGPCARCLGEAVLEVHAEQQEFAPTAKDGWEETETSEFIEDLVVDVDGLAREALVLASAGPGGVRRGLQGTVRASAAKTSTRAPAGAPPRSTTMERWNRLKDAERSKASRLGSWLLKYRRRWGTNTRFPRGIEVSEELMAVPKRKTSKARRDARRVHPCRRGAERERMPAVPQPQAVPSRVPELRHVQRPAGGEGRGIGFPALMQIVVQEGEASVSLTMTIQAPDDSLRTNSLNVVTGPVKVFYRDFEIDPRRGARGGAGAYCRPISRLHHLAPQEIAAIS